MCNEQYLFYFQWKCFTILHLENPSHNCTCLVLSTGNKMNNHQNVRKRWQKVEYWCLEEKKYHPRSDFLCCVDVENHRLENVLFSRINNNDSFGCKLRFYYRWNIVLNILSSIHTKLICFVLHVSPLKSALNTFFWRKKNETVYQCNERILLLRYRKWFYCRWWGIKWVIIAIGKFIWLSNYFSDGSKFIQEQWDFRLKKTQHIRYANTHSHSISPYNRLNESFLLVLRMECCILNAECTRSAVEVHSESNTHKNSKAKSSRIGLDVEIRSMKKTIRIKSWWLRLLWLAMQCASRYFFLHISLFYSDLFFFCLQLRLVENFFKFSILEREL